MVCNKCKNIISENSLRCPFCGNKTADDYFGYQKANDMMQIQQSQPRPKDKSGKIILVVLSAVGGLFSIVCMLFFAFSGFGNSGIQGSGQNSGYDAVFSVNNNFDLTVADTSSAVSITVTSTADNKNSGTYNLNAGNSVNLDYPDGVYEVLISKSLNDYIRLQVTVSNSSSFSEFIINYDTRQIMVIGNDGASDVYDSSSTDNSSGNTGNNPVINETTTLSDASQNNSGVNFPQNNSSGSNYDCDYDRKHFLSGKIVARSNGSGFTQTISYEKTADGYKMIIKKVSNTGEYENSTAYFDSDKKLISVERDTNYDYYGVKGNITHKYIYDGNGFIKSEVVSDSDGNGVALEYQCNSDGNIINAYRSGTYGMAQEIVYEYNGQNVVKKYWLYGGSSEYYYEYDGDRIIKESAYSSDDHSLSTETYYTYDSLNRLTGIKNINYYNDPLGDVDAEYFCTYDGITLSSCTGYERYSSTEKKYSITYGYDDRNNIISTYEQIASDTIQTDYKYEYLSYEFDGLLDEYCQRFGNSPTGNYLYNMRTPYVLF